MSDLQSITPPAFDPGDWETEQSNRVAAGEAIRPANKAALFDALANAGITEILVEFDGYGDSGQIENIDARTGNKTVDLPDVEIQITKLGWRDCEPRTAVMIVGAAVEYLAYDYLEQTHCGWENNDGAFGTFTFDVGKRAISLEHHERYTETQSYDHKF